MKYKTSVLSCASLIAAAGIAGAQTRPYAGSDTLELFTETLVAQCQALGGVYAGVADFDYIGGGSTAGGNAMRNGTQDVSPQSRPLSASEFCTTSIPAAPTGEAALSGIAPGSRADNLAVAVDGLSVMTSRPSALRCDSDGTSGDDTGVTADFGSALAFSGTTLPVTDFPDDGVAPPVASYAFNSWRDVLRVLWAGADNTRSAADGGGSGQNASNRVARCTSDIRRTLVANWDNIVAGDAACAGVAGSCQNATTGAGLPLRHIFRRDDLSGTTDTFLGLLGLTTTLSNQPFCNGLDTEDNDPIRSRCTINSPTPAAAPTNNATQLNDETCGVDQTKGLVTAVRAITFVGTSNSATSAGNRSQPTLDDLYPRFNCATGVFAVRRPPAVFNNTQTCPDGAPYLFTGCLTPVAAPGSIVPEDPSISNDSAGEADCSCVNAWTNRAPGTPDRNPSIGGLQNDGRMWNRIMRGHPGRYGNGPNPCPVLRDQLGNEVITADFRLRYRQATVNGHPVPADRVCRQVDATRTIGCVSRAAECAIGFAGREAVIDKADDPSTPGVDESYDASTAVLLGNVDNNPASPPAGPNSAAIYSGLAGSGYPLARKLYFNSIVGFESIIPVGESVTFNDSSGSPVAINGLGERLPTATPREAVQLLQCLQNEATPITEALTATGFLPVNPSGDPEPFVDTIANATCL